jgi:putative endonuclease
MAAHNDIGKLGEDLAAQFLEREDFVIFDRNYRCEGAEVDIVALWTNPRNPALVELHFVEVKTLKDTRFVQPEDAVDATKMKNIAKVAQFYCFERQLHNIPAVFDIISVALDDMENPVIKHFEDFWRPETRY